MGRGEALPRPHPATPRVAHRPEALPRDLFVPGMNERVGMNDGGRPGPWGEALPCDLFVAAMNERVGMNDRGRPGGSPLRVGTHGAFGRTVGARPCLAI